MNRIIARALGQLRGSARRVVDWPLTQRTRFPCEVGALAGRDESVPGPVAVSRTDVPAVNLYGFMSGTLGLGQVARLYARALIEAGVRVKVFDVTLGVEGARCTCTEGAGAVADDQVNLVFVNPDHFLDILPWLAQERGDTHLYTIAMWFWELPVIPAHWKDALVHVDEFWVASSFISEAFRGYTRKPVVLMPPPIAPTRYTGPGNRHCLGLPEKAYVFLFVFDFHSFYARKNPEAVVDAFRAAFPSDVEDVRLVIKSSNGLFYRKQLRSLLRRKGGDRRILVRNQTLDYRQMAVLRDSCDAYVSLHRSEGLGLTLAEFMALGKPVVATNWSGNTDFMNSGNSFPINYKLVPVGDGQYPDAAGGLWADPNIADAAKAMRLLFDDAALRVQIGAKARATIDSTLHSVQAGNRMADRLQHAVRQL